MKTIELTDEQLLELKVVIRLDLERLERRLRKFPRPDAHPDVVAVKNTQAMLADIFRLLEEAK